MNQAREQLMSQEGPGEERTGSEARGAWLEALLIVLSFSFVLQLH